MTSEERDEAQDSVAPILTTGSGSFRSDIQGLRAVAVVLVLLYHARSPGFQGGYIGVDVFFVISGFLITGLIIRELEQRGTLDLKRFYARRIRRLLPVAALTLLAVAMLTVLVLPVIRWASIGKDIAWSALYAVNWRFAAQAVDYLAAEDAASPLQHFWSLAVEEQFYIIWPVLMLGLGILATRYGWATRPVLLTGLLIVGLPSFTWSVYLTLVDPGRAFFVSTTRVWELAVGGGLAIAAPYTSRLSRGTASIAALLGLSGILLSGIAYSDSTAFPGYAALLPVVSTAVVIGAGVASEETLVGRVLGLKPMVLIGAMSYSLYLWHWPLLVVARSATDIGRKGSLAVVVLSIVPAALTYRFVEQRWHRSPAFVSPPTRGLRLGLALTLVGVVAGASVFALVPDSIAGLDAIRPHPIRARDDIPEIYGNGCHQDSRSSDVAGCTYGLLDSDFDVVILGDSHAAQWVPALRLIAARNGWSLRTMTKSGCQFADVVIARGDGKPNTSCARWNANVLTELSAERPDAIVVAGVFWPSLLADGRSLTPEEIEAELTSGLERSWSTLIDRELATVAIRDVPHSGVDIPECVVENAEEPAKCDFDRMEAMNLNTPHIAAAAALGMASVDLTDAICFPSVCPAVRNNILVWRDSHHLTATYSESLADVLEKELRSAAPNLRWLSSQD